MDSYKACYWEWPWTGVARFWNFKSRSMSSFGVVPWKQASQRQLNSFESWFYITTPKINLNFDFFCYVHKWIICKLFQTCNLLFIFVGIVAMLLLWCQVVPWKVQFVSSITSPCIPSYSYDEYDSKWQGVGNSCLSWMNTWHIALLRWGRIITISLLVLWIFFSWHL
jgi:hypothetical protein